MTVRKTLVSRSLAAAVAFALVFVVTLSFRGHPAAGPDRPDALAEELSAITARHARIWDAARDEAGDERHKAEMRREWRRAYHADVREACKQHGRTPPAWARGPE